LHRGTPGHMRLPHRLQGQKVKSQGGAGAYCGGDLAAQLVIEQVRLQDTNLPYGGGLLKLCATPEVGLLFKGWQHLCQLYASI